jgi:hypothetical protein
VNDRPPCGGNVAQIASTPEFGIVSDSDIQGWECSVHETWPKFPADWNAQAVATDTPTHPTCGTDPGTGKTACGEAYVLLAGSGSVVTSPDLSLSPTTASNATGTSHTITATVAIGGTPEAGDAVTFAIASGPNAGAKGTCTFSNGTADPGCLTGADGKVLFTYHDGGGAGTDTIDASVTLKNGTTEHASATKTWDQLITGKGTSISGSAGKSLTATVATFSDADSKGTASEYSATINWGDGTSSKGTISGSAGKFSVSGTHTYKKGGKYKVTVTITDVDTASNTAKVTSTATIGAVKAARVSARLSSVPAACVSSAFTARVQGTRIASVRFTLDGSQKRTTTVRRHREYSSRIRVSPGRHTLTVRVTFTRGSASRFRTFRRAVTGCTPPPTFTG